MVFVNIAYTQLQSFFLEQPERCEFLLSEMF